MQKKIGKEGSKSGQFNIMRLAAELKQIAITLFEVDPETGDIYLTFSDELENQVDAICAAHIPEPLPVPLTDIEQTQLAVAEAVEKQEADKVELQLAIAEAIEMLAGGGE